MTLTRYAPSFARPRMNGHGWQSAWLPATDIQEVGNEYVIQMDVPGLEEKDVDIQVHQGVLTVAGERKADETVQPSYTLRERRSGKFERTFRLSSRVDADAITARYDRGVLEIRIPKTDNRRQIPIQ